MITLGNTYTDSVTKFKGVAVSRTVYLNGCVHIALQGPVDKEGKLPPAEYFDEQRVDPESPVTTGGPADHPPQIRPLKNADRTR